jgi:GT2 family glycosyltransferase
MAGQVVIVVLNYNGQKCLTKTLASLGALSYQEKEVLVVDNASTDGSFLDAQKKFPEYSYLALPRNGGFGYGMNQGIEYAMNKQADYVWLFNYDALAERDALEPLVAEAKRREDKVLLSPCIIDQYHQNWFSGGKINFWRMRVEHDRGPAPIQVSETSFLTGCALFLPMKVIQEVGLLDEDFFLYYEDADYSMRAQNKQFPLAVVPRSRVLHSEESQCNPTKIYHLVLSGLIFFEKHQKRAFALYQAIYVILRRLKNQVDVLLRLPQASRVREAYTDFYARKTASHFSHLR